MDIKNIFSFSGIHDQSGKEILETILKTHRCRIERIISRGHSTDKGDWYNQEEDEWVILLKGSAGLLFEGSDDVVTMKPGDYINIPAHKRHRVEWTDHNVETIWLAVHHQTSTSGVEPADPDPTNTLTNHSRR